MRASLQTIVLLTFVAITGCRREATDSPDSNVADALVDAAPNTLGLPLPAHGFQMAIPRFKVPAFAQNSVCYFFNTPAEVSAVSSFVMKGTNNIRSVVVATEILRGSPVSNGVQGCSVAADNEFIFAALQTSVEVVMPQAVALPIPPKSLLMFRIEVLNASNASADVEAAINIETYSDNVVRMPAHMLMAFNQKTDLPAATASGPGAATIDFSCQLPTDLKYFSIRTGTESAGTRMKLSDGDIVLGESVDWKQPIVVTKTNAPYVEFTSAIKTHCEFANTTANKIVIDPLPGGRDSCTTFAYFFPSNRSYVCNNGLIFP
jgi:hypothetical protein